jgi:hypothetical protein
MDVCKHPEVIQRAVNPCLERETLYIEKCGEMFVRFIFHKV